MSRCMMRRAQVVVPSAKDCGHLQEIWINNLCSAPQTTNHLSVTRQVRYFEHALEYDWLEKCLFRYGDFASDRSETHFVLDLKWRRLRQLP